MAQKFKSGDKVKFDDFEEPSIKHHGEVLNYLPPDESGFVGGYHVACYFVVSEDSLQISEPAVLAKEEVL